MALWILRAVYVLVSAGIATQLIYSGAMPQDQESYPMLILGVVLLISVAVIMVDVLLPRKRLDIVTSVYFGLLIGLFLAFVLRTALTPILPNEAGFGASSPPQVTVQIITPEREPPSSDAEASPDAEEGSIPLARPQIFVQPTRNLKTWDEAVVQGAQLILASALCYGCISLLIQTKDDFRFIIPYVEFSRHIKGPKPYILDTSVVIDGRIADVIDTKVVDNELIMPRFVIGELQGIADSTDKTRRVRGRRGLDILNRLRSDENVDIKIFDRDLPEFAGQPVDLKLVLLAKHLGGKVVTNDYNLNKVAKLHGVEVINLNDLTNALKPVFMPGEVITVRIMKYGEEHAQGVAYLDDGTMVIVEGGREHLNKSVRATVTNVLQTSAGRMIFGRYESAAAPEKATT